MILNVLLTTVLLTTSVNGIWDTLYAANKGKIYARNFGLIFETLFFSKLQPVLHLLNTVGGRPPIQMANYFLAPMKSTGTSKMQLPLRLSRKSSLDSKM